MTKMVKSLFGGDKAAKEAQQLQQQQAAAAQRRQLADLARQQAETDKASGVIGSNKRGRSLLTFLTAAGQGSLG